MPVKNLTLLGACFSSLNTSIPSLLPFTQTSTGARAADFLAAAFRCALLGALLLSSDPPTSERSCRSMHACKFGSEWTAGTEGGRLRDGGLELGSERAAGSADGGLRDDGLDAEPTRFWRLSCDLETLESVECLEVDAYELNWSDTIVVLRPQPKNKLTTRNSSNIRSMFFTRGLPAWNDQKKKIRIPLGLKFSYNSRLKQSMWLGKKGQHQFQLRCLSPTDIRRFVHGLTNKSNRTMSKWIRPNVFHRPRERIFHSFLGRTQARHQLRPHHNKQR